MAGIQLGLQRFGVTTPEKEFITVNTTKNSPGARRDFNTGFGKPGAPGATVRYVKDIPNPNYRASTQGAGGSGGSGGPAPNDGQYGNIVSNLDYQAQAAKAQQDYWANKATEDANANAAKAASMEAEKAAAAAATKQQQSHCPKDHLERTTQRALQRRRRLHAGGWHHRVNDQGLTQGVIQPSPANGAPKQPVWSNNQKRWPTVSA